MADPISVAGSAVGIICLGITVSQSLVSYYTSYKGCHGEIKSICLYLEVLSSTLLKLGSCLQSHAFKATARQQVDVAIAACTGDISSLQKKLLKIKQVQIPTTLRERWDSQLMRAKYPFREGTLKKLRDNVTSMQGNLQLAVELLNLDTLAFMSPTTDAILNEVTGFKQQFTGLSSELGLLQAKTEDSHRRLPLVHSDIVAVQNSVLNVEDDIQRVEEQLRGFASNLDFLPHVQQKLENLPHSVEATIVHQFERYGQERMQLLQLGAPSIDLAGKLEAIDSKITALQLRTISQPSLMSSVLHEVGSCTTPVSKRRLQGRMRSAPIFRPTDCNCRSFTCSNKQWSLGSSFVIHSSRAADHSKDCPFYHRSQRTVTVGSKYIYAGRLLAKAIDVSLTMKYGAGGLSLGSFIRIRGVVRENSLAFRLFEDLLWEHDEVGEQRFMPDLNSTLYQLKRLYEDGEAAPDDVNIHGETVLYAAIRFFQRHLYKPCSRIQAARQSILLSIIRLGVPIVEGDVERTAQYELASPVIDAQWQTVAVFHEFGPTPAPDWSALCVYRGLGGSDGYNDVYSGGILSDAVLAKSEASVSRLLKRYRHTVTESNRLGQTPLHLAVDWPWGVTRLLQAGASVSTPDRDGLYPINYACSCKCLTTVKLLIEAESPMCCNLSYGYSMKLDVKNTEIEDVMLMAVVDRRRRLAAMGLRCLSAEDQPSLFRAELGVLDRYAYDVYRSLVHAGVEVEEALQVSKEYGTVYHDRMLTVSMAEKFWRSGFWDVNSIYDGMTPLALAANVAFKTQDLDLYRWLLSKKADPLKIVSDLGTTSLHYVSTVISSWIMCYHRRDTSCIERFTNFQAILELFLCKEHLFAKDFCTCACSPSGCSPLDQFLRISHRDPFHPTSVDGEGRVFGASPNGLCKGCLRDKRILYEMLEAYRGAPEVLDEFVVRFTRQCLFVEIGLTHTCCARTYGFIYAPIKSRIPDLADVEKIHEEQRELIAEYEELCEEAKSEWADYSGHVADFLEGFLLTLHQKRSELPSKEELRKLQEIGVKIHCIGTPESGNLVELESDSEVEDTEEPEHESGVNQR